MHFRTIEGSDAIALRAQPDPALAPRGRSDDPLISDFDQVDVDRLEAAVDRVEAIQQALGGSPGKIDLFTDPEAR
ncbi:MAG: hypothetical protein ACOC3I_11345 [Verrucomicrobiota bacterium]